MIRVHELRPRERMPALKTDLGIDPVSEVDLEVQAPDLHMAVAAGTSLAARASCWWSTTPRAFDEHIGAIGHFAAADRAVATALLGRACAVLADAGCTLAVGPMDGNTWRRYRFITERGDAPQFFLEPDNADEWPAHWTACGFTPLATYTSAAADDLTARDARTGPARDNLRREGITIRSFDERRADEELHRIYMLSLAAFSQNFLYTPLDEREFTAANRALLPHVRPELILLAERDGELVGFMFAVPDLLQATRGETIDTIVLKTMAVDPALRGLGLGAVLMEDVRRAAAPLGYRRAIHALMHETNRSRALSDRYARTIRRYTLFSRRLGRP